MNTNAQLNNTYNTINRKLKTLDSTYKIYIIENEELNDSSFECREGCVDIPYIQNLFWTPIKNISNRVELFCNNNNYKNILEIGPGIEQFPLATTFIGYNEKIKNYIEIDIDVDKIPATDKSFDFIYSRHTMEDIQNPLKSRGWFKYDNALIAQELLETLSTNKFYSSFLNDQQNEEVQTNFELVDLVLDPTKVNYLAVFRKK